MISRDKRMAICKKLVGWLIWTIQTRPDVNHRICQIASSAAASILIDAEFCRWVKNANRLVEVSKKKQYAFITDLL